jgi:RNA polymerase sigma-70 factor (ECF subfamily)
MGALLSSRKCFDLQRVVACYSSKERLSKRFLQRIFHLYERCRAAEYGFTPAEFCSLIGEIAKRQLGAAANEREQMQFAATLHLDDLVLARACARGHEGAWERFVSLYREKLYAASLAIARQESAARELADSVYADLFGTRTGNDGKRKSKLESYCGRGSLEGWLRSVLAQAYIDRVRVEQKLVVFDEAVELCEHANPEPAGYDSRVAECTDAELAALGPEEKLLLAAYYLDGRTLAEIGRMLSLHESTVARRLEKTISRLRKRIIGRLRAMGFAGRIAEEMLEMDIRNLNIDVRKHLAQEGQG